jgi:hypothetical protein
MRPYFVKDASGARYLVRNTLTAVAAAVLLVSAGAAHAGPSSTNNQAGANIFDGIVVATEPPKIELGNGAFLGLNRGSVLSRDAAGMSLRPGGQLVTAGGDNPHLEASHFFAAITLTGRPNQAFGISALGSTILNSSGSPHSVRTFEHDAGPTPAMGTRGNSHFNVGAVFWLEEDPDRKSRVYIWAVDIIVSNN